MATNNPWGPRHRDALAFHDKIETLDHPVSAHGIVKGLSSPLIKLLVGPKKEELVAPRDILRSVPFFAAALSGSFKESQTGIVELPDETPETMTYFLAWLLQGRAMWDDADLLDGAYECLVAAVNLIILADKWMVPALTLQAYEMFWDALDPNGNRWEYHGFMEEVQSAHSQLISTKARYLPIACACFALNGSVFDRCDILAPSPENSADYGRFWRDYSAFDLALRL